MWQNVIQNESVAAGSNHVGFYKSREEFWLHRKSSECEVKGRDHDQIIPLTSLLWWKLGGLVEKVEEWVKSVQN